MPSSPKRKQRRRAGRRPDDPAADPNRSDRRRAARPGRLRWSTRGRRLAARALRAARAIRTALPRPARGLWTRLALKPDRAVHALFAVTLAAVGGAALVALVVLMLAGRPPSWWREPLPSDPATVAGAERVEQQVATALAAPRDHGRVWTMTITDLQAAAWLNVRLPLWMANNDVEWPISDTPITLIFRTGGLLAAARVDHDGDQRIVGAAFEPTVADSGAVRAGLRSLHIGSLGLPADLGAAYLQPLVPQDAARDPVIATLLEDVLLDRPLIADPSWSVDRGRRVRLLSVDFTDGAATITWRTETRLADQNHDHTPPS